jgi:SAM-dependent methyltransferase
VPDQHAFWDEGGSYRRPDHPVVALFARQRTRYLEAHGLLDGVETLLDVGAGNGFSSAYYPSRVRVVACDYAAGMLDANPAPHRVRCSASALPFGDASFDAVACWELLHHLDDPVAALREMGRVAGRRLIVFEPNRIHPGHVVLGLTRVEERASLRFTPGHVRRLLRAAGLVPDRQERCGVLFPNVTPLWLARGLVRLPYRVPIVGISQLVVVERGGAPAPGEPAC